MVLWGMEIRLHYGGGVCPLGERFVADEEAYLLGVFSEWL